MRIEDKASFPRPDFVRENYLSLNGTWQIGFDDSAEPLTPGSLKKELPGRPITVPFPYQSPASGIGDTAVHNKMCYSRPFTLTGEQASQTVLLKFGAVDHKALVFVNGSFVGSHTGGYTPFAFDITAFVNEGENALTVWVEDFPSKEQVRGKQIWDEEPFGCFYTAVSGIWQEVWLEFTGPRYILRVAYETDLEARRVTARILLNAPVTGCIALAVSKAGEPLFTVTRTLRNTDSFAVTFHMEEYGFRDSHFTNWSPAHPNLFDCDITLTAENGEDSVSTYFGIRKIAADGDKIYLNNSQIYLRGVLDQGYWSEGIYRPRTDDGFCEDVELTLGLGFNMARKHQKIEDPKYYYWADRLGLLVWGEMPSFFAYSERAVADSANTLTEFIERDYNHPCLMAWVPFNESWGLRMLLGDSRHRDTARRFYYLCKSKDPSRLVSTNDGWECLTQTDLAGIHDYRVLGEKLIAYYSNPDFLKSGAARTGHPYVIPGENCSGLPLLMTEFGGRGVKPDETGRVTEASFDAWKTAITADVEGVLAIPAFCGYCFTQLTDVYQEQNGLTDMARRPKADAEELKALFSRKAKEI